MERALNLIFAIKPLLFAFGFLTPVLAQGLRAGGVSQFAGMSVLAASAVVCGLWGLIAAFRKGRWI